MLCVISGIAQEMDLEQNTTLTYLILRLPSGAVVRAAVDDSAVTEIMEAHVGENGPPQAAIQPPAPAPRPVAPVAYSAPEETGDVVHVFGGHEPEPSMPVAEAPAPAPVPTPPALKGSVVQRLPNGKMVVGSRSVPKDEYGYPLVPNAGINTADITGSRDPDEDGVGSV